MMRWLGPLAVGIIAAGLGHWLVLTRAPTAIMDAALGQLAERGVPLHGFRMSPPSTPDTQTIVRPAPDLAYSACRFDLAQIDGPLKVRMAQYDRYSSLSFFDSETNNFLTVRGEGEAREVLLAGPDQGPQPGIAVSPTQRGLIVIRRLSPNAKARAEVEAVAQGDICAPS